MAGLDPAIHVFLLAASQAWMPGHLAQRRASRFCPGMTADGYAARTLAKNPPPALRGRPDWLASSRALESTSEAARPVADAADVRADLVRSSRNRLDVARDFAGGVALLIDCGGQATPPAKSRA